MAMEGDDHQYHQDDEDEEMLNPIFEEDKQQGRSQMKRETHGYVARKPKGDQPLVMKALPLVLQVITLLVVTVSLVLGIVNVAQPSCGAGSSPALLTQVAQLMQLTKNVSMSIGYSPDYSSLMQAYQSSRLVLQDMVGSLSDIKGYSKSTDGAVDDILLAIQDILAIQNKSTFFNSIKTVSCMDILSAYPNSPTGVYHVNGRDIYCNMGQLCGSGGGWTRLAYLDMSDATTSCPTGYRLYTSGTVRACGRPAGGASCTQPLIYHTNGINYTQICGRVTGYQHGTPDAVDTRGNPTNDINSYYLDGVSVTRGSPREHVWSLMGGVSEAVSDDGNCPCNNPPGTQRNVPFIGTNYFCESGNPTGVNFTFFPNDPLWDGQKCGSEETSCCAASLGLPWFHRQWTATSSKYVELRVCGNQGTNDEDTPISYYEIYVK